MKYEMVPHGRMVYNEQTHMFDYIVDFWSESVNEWIDIDIYESRGDPPKPPRP